MGLFDSIVDTVKDFAGPIMSGIGGMFGGPTGSAIGGSIGNVISGNSGSSGFNISDILNSLLKGLTQSIVPSALTLGSDYLRNQMINLPNAASAYTQSKQGAEEAFRRQLDLYKTRYRYTMNDMEKAGLNPILAVSSGFNVGSGLSSPAASGFMASPPQTDLSSARNLADTSKKYEEVEEVRNKVKNLISQREVNDQNIKESLSRIRKNRAETRKITQEEKNLVKELLNIEKEFYVKAKKIDVMTEEIRFINENTMNLTENRKLTIQRVGEVKANIEKLRQDAILLKATGARLKKIAKVYDGPIGNILGYADSILKVFGIPIVGLGALGVGAKVGKKSIPGFVNKLKSNSWIKNIIRRIKK